MPWDSVGLGICVCFRQAPELGDSVLRWVGWLPAQTDGRCKVVDAHYNGCHGIGRQGYGGLQTLNGPLAYIEDFGSPLSVTMIPSADAA